MEIKDMADILLKGGKMLSKSCPKCNAPLFQHEGRTFCPRCNWEEGRAPPEPGGQPELPSEEVKEMGPEPWNTLNDAQSAVISRIQEYSEKLRSPAENANLSANIDALSDLLDLLDRIVEMKSKR